MITFLKTLDTAGGKYVEGFCTSDDLENLPIMGICNGSKMEVLDAEAGTLAEYRYNATGGAWVEIVEAEEEITATGSNDAVSDGAGGTGS